MDVTMVPHKRWANSSFNQPQLVVCGCYHGSSWEMGQLKFQSTTTGCLWMLPWFLMRDGANSSFNQPQLVVYGCYHGSSWEIGQLPQVLINHNWLFLDVAMVPCERCANSSFNPPQLVYGCYHGSQWEMGQLNFQSSTTGCLWMFPWFLMRDGPTQVSINHNWLFMDVTMVPHKRWANSSFNHPQLVVYGCYHGSSWEMGQLKFQSSTTGCFWMLPWYLMRDGPTQLSILHNWLFMDVSMVPHERWANSSVNQPQLVVYGCYHGSS